jgi:predicted amino acid-binding ACT domain protein
VFGDLGALSTSEARVVLGAAVADDVMGLIVLTVVVRVVTQGTVSIISVLLILLGAVAFLVVGGAIALWLAPHLFTWVERVSRSAGTLVALALAFTLAFAELADVANLAVVVGAFVAGLALGRAPQAPRIRRELAPVGHLFIPVFFLAIGIDVDVSAFGQLTVLRDAGILLVVAVIGKLISAFGAAGTRNDRMLVGLGMLPRGEVGLIFATIGLNAGILGDDLYAALLLVVLATTLGTPVLLRARYQKLSEQPVDDGDGGAAEPPGGWFTLDDGELALAATPGAHRTLELALTASRRVARVDPSSELLDWFSAHRTTPLTWSRTATEAFFALLRDGNARSWRFLEALDVLPRALPELAPALRGRRDDPFIIDPTGLHRWDTLERLQEFVRSPAGADAWATCRDQDAIRLAAFLVDVLGDRDDRVASTRQLAQRFELGARIEEQVATLVEDPRLLMHAARRRDAFAEQPVAHLAGHYGDIDATRGAFILASALADDALDRHATRELYGLVDAVLRASNWNRDAANLVQRRRREATEASDGSEAVAQRIADAPRAYLMLERPRRVARHAALLARWSRRGKDRYLVEVEGPTRHDPRIAVDVVAPDRPGLLARVAHVLAAENLDIEHAIVATWPDGCALESFLVSGGGAIDAHALRQMVSTALEAPFASGAVAGAAVEFDDALSPWNTVCRVTARDAHGLLGAITAAIAGADVDVQSAEIRLDGVTATDTFELVGAAGKLRADERATILDNLREGVVLPAPRRPWGRAWDRLRGSWSSGTTQVQDTEMTSQRD